MVSFAVWLTPTMVKILLAQSKLAHCLHLPQPPSSLSLLSFFRIEVYGAINPLLGFAGGSAVKNPCANAGDVGNAGWIPRSGRSPGVGNGNPLRNSCLENSIDRGAWLQSMGVYRHNWAHAPNLHVWFQQPLFCSFSKTIYEFWWPQFCQKYFKIFANNPFPQMQRDNTKQMELNTILLCSFCDKTRKNSIGHQKVA